MKTQTRAINYSKKTMDKAPSFKELAQKASEIHHLLGPGQKTLSVAESLTGGLVSYLLSLKPGASRFFSGAVVSYSPSSKTRQLKVPTKLLKREGTVNKSVCLFMAQGVKKKWSSDYGLSITGVAGPGKNEQDPPVGTVFVGFSGPKGEKSRGFLVKEAGKKASKRERHNIQKKSAFLALDFLQNCIKKE